MPLTLDIEARSSVWTGGVTTPPALVVAKPMNR
jgi:hypothetical protein